MRRVSIHVIGHPCHLFHADCCCVGIHLFLELDVRIFTVLFLSHSCARDYVLGYFM